MIFDQLRQTREARKLSTQDVSLRTRIPALYIDAIEKGRWDRLPSPVRTKNYIAVYARFLRLNPEPFVKSYSYNTGEQKTVKPVVASYSRAQRFQTSRVNRTKRQSKKNAFLSNLSIPTKWLYIGSGVAGLCLLLGLWLMLGEGDSSASNIDEKEKNSTPVAYFSNERPTIKLVQTAESSDQGDVYQLTKVPEIIVKVEGSGSVKIRGEGPNGPILANKTLIEGSPIEVHHPKWITVYLEKPAQIHLVVNGFVIETSNLTEAHTFQFKLPDA